MPIPTVRLNRSDVADFNSITTSTLPAAPRPAAPIVRKPPAAPSAPASPTPRAELAPAISRAIGAPSPYPMGYERTPAPAASFGPPKSLAGAGPMPAVQPPRPRLPGEDMVDGLAQGNYFNKSNPGVSRPSIAQRLGGLARSATNAGGRVVDALVGTAKAARDDIGAIGGDLARGYRGAPSPSDVQMPPPMPVRAASPLAAAPAVATPAVSASLVPTLDDVQVPDSTPKNPALSASGRVLPYGRMVDGVPTFSDGFGRISRTISDEQIKNLAGVPGNPIISANGANGPAVTRPSLSAPMLPGGAVAPSASSAGTYGISRPAADPIAAAAARARADAFDVARYAQSDALSMALQDPRSPAGIAARNAAVGVQYARGKGARAGALARQQALTDGVMGAHKAAQDQIGQVGLAGLQSATDLARTRIGADADIARSIIQRPRPQMSQITLEGGGVAQYGDDGIARPITTPDGLPVRARREVVQPARGDQYLKTVDSLAQRLLGIDPISGQRPGGGAPTAQEVESAMLRARSIADQTLGATPPASQRSPTREEFMAEAQKANPGVSAKELSDYYNANYGG